MPYRFRKFRRSFKRKRSYRRSFRRFGFKRRSFRRSSRRVFARRATSRKPGMLKLGGFGYPFADRTFVKVTYNSSPIIIEGEVEALPIFKQEVWRMNCPLDPMVGGSPADNVSALGHGLYSQVYSRYVCYGSKISVSITNLSTFPVNAYIYIMRATETETGANFILAFDPPEQDIPTIGFPWRMRRLGSSEGSHNVVKLSMPYVSVARIAGVPKHYIKANTSETLGTSSLYGSEVQKYPRYSPSYILKLFTADGEPFNENYNVSVRTKIVHYVEYYDRRFLGQLQSQNEGVLSAGITLPTETAVLAAQPPTIG